MPIKKLEKPFILLLLSVTLASQCFIKVTPHVVLLVGILVLLAYGIAKKVAWGTLEQYMVDGIFQAFVPMLILSMIGILVGVWMLSGTIPTILYYGLQYISPRWYYVSCVIFCLLASSFNGSCVATISTVGVALIGVAEGLGLPLPIAAGAIVSGACFGDKCSPLSETTNLAPGILNVDLYVHVKHLFWTTVPALFLTLAIFGYLGIHTEQTNIAHIAAMSDTLETHFNVSSLTLLSPLLVLLLSMRKVPALATFILGIVSGLVTAALVQQNLDLPQWAEVVQNGFTLESGDRLVDKLVSRGGLQSMMGSLSLVSIALAFGGLLNGLELTKYLLNTFASNLKTRGWATLAASFSCVAINFLSGEQYLSIILPGKTFEKHFRDHGIPLKNLSRTLEDCGTLVNPLVPWGVCGAFFYGALRVSVLEYAPYAFFLYLCPLFTVLLGFFNIDNSSLKTSHNPS
ncbi:MAG: Na+/H+ antiporter NhaC [Bacteroidota bacterium]